MYTYRHHAAAIFALAAALLFPDHATHAADHDQKGIQVYEANPFYWQFNGQATLLLGASNNDNIFQTPVVDKEIRLLKSAGGNYLRCTMSSRDSGDLFPYVKDQSGKFNLREFNPQYWERFERFLSLTASSDVVVQVEIWATYDFYKDAWKGNPYNPANNTNYDRGSSGLPETHQHDGWTKLNPFFNSIPKLGNNELLLQYQSKFVDRLLKASLPHNHVLYTIDNETNAHPEWGKYWTNYIKKKAAKENKKIHVTEMWDNWDPTGGSVPGIRDIQSIDDHPHLHRSTPLNTIDHPEIYDFIDISNNNGQVGQVHYETGLWVRSHIARQKLVRPINNVKIYGGPRDEDWCRDGKEGKERFWRNIFAGHAAVRFHRPPSGIGINREARVQVRSARMAAGTVDFFTMAPSNGLLGGRSENEAYCLANDRGEYLLYFPGRGEVTLNAQPGEYRKATLDLSNATWGEAETIRLPGSLQTDMDRPVVVKLVK